MQVCEADTAEVIHWGYLPSAKLLRTVGTVIYGASATGCAPDISLRVFFLFFSFKVVFPSVEVNMLLARY